MLVGMYGTRDFFKQGVKNGRKSRKFASKLRKSGPSTLRVLGQLLAKGVPPPERVL